VSSPPQVADLAGRRVLVVEDEMLVAMLLSDILAELGCQVVGPAGDVARALALVGEAVLDCALLDVSLGGEEVFPVALALAARELPFVFVTGHAEPLAPPFEDRPRLIKPYLPAEVADALRRCLGLAPV
jgi:CheY-like chemotaxis protein